jgi:hypothetical protein
MKSLLAHKDHPLVSHLGEVANGDKGTPCFYAFHVTIR